MRLVYFSPSKWRAQAQRPHFFAKYFLERVGNEVLWVEPVPGRFPGLRDLWRPGLERERGEPNIEGIEMVSIGGLPVEPIPGVRRLNTEIFGRKAMDRIKQAGREGAWLVIGKPVSPALAAIPFFNPEQIFYDAMDDFPLFFSGLARNSSTRIEKDIARSVSMVLASSTELVKKFKEQGVTVQEVRNAYDPEAITRKSARCARNKIGFVGTIAHWFDWELVVSVARALPDFTVELVGPLSSRKPRDLPANIDLIGPCPHVEAMRYVEGFCAGLIPFRDRSLIQAVDPVKFYEYRAFGIPTLSTRVGQMAYRGQDEGVFFLDNAQSLQQLAATVNEALGWSAPEEGLDPWLNENTWRARFARSNLFGEVEGVERDGRCPLEAM